MNRKALTLAAVTFIPATLSGAIRTGVGLGFNIGPVNLGFMVHDDEPHYYEGGCFECATCARLINGIADELYNMTMETSHFKNILADVGVGHQIRHDIGAYIRDIYHDWRSYANHCCCTCPDALAEIKQSAHEMVRAMRSAARWKFSSSSWETEDNARDVRDALAHVYSAMQSRVSTDHLADDMAECARCIRTL